MDSDALASQSLVPSSLKLAECDNRKRATFHCSLAETQSAQLDPGHHVCFVTKHPDLYVEREQQLLSLCPGTISILEDGKEDQEKENSLRGG